MAENERTRRLAAILAGDVAGYTRLMASDEAATFETPNLGQAANHPPPVRNGRPEGAAA